MLDWVDIQRQIESYSSEQKRQKEASARYTGQMVDCLTCHKADWHDWKNRALAESAELLPDFDEFPLVAHPVAEASLPCTAVSSDGSQVFPSSHEVAGLALISASRIRLDYGQTECLPLLDCVARLVRPDEVTSGSMSHVQVSFREYVSDQRTLFEVQTLAELAEAASGGDTVALSDGSLIVWRIAGRNDQPYEAAFVRSYVDELARFRGCGVPVGGYISRSGSREVVKFIEFILQKTGSDLQSCPVTDTQVFARVLKRGERSTVFHSRSKVMQQYGDDAVACVFLHTGDEIARVEFPRWVNGDLLDALLGQCLFQARIGGGYPVVVAEAHEHAVIRGADRETFYALVEQALLRDGLTPRLSAKQLRKNASVL